jgi:death-on-curing protein
MKNAQEPIWISREIIVAAHKALLDQFGGLDGIRDERMLDSALNRPLNAWDYGVCDVFRLSALYAAGIVQNHPFLDGNKRCAFLVATLFLENNGYVLRCTDEGAAEQTLALTTGDFSEAAYAQWLSANSDYSGFS